MSFVSLQKYALLIQKKSFKNILIVHEKGVPTTSASLPWIHPYLGSRINPFYLYLIFTKNFCKLKLIGKNCDSMNPFLVNISILYPLKQIHLIFSGGFIGYEIGTLVRNELSLKLLNKPFVRHIRRFCYLR